MKTTSELQAEADALRAKSFLPLAQITLRSISEDGIEIEMNKAVFLMRNDWNPTIGVKAPYILKIQPIA